MKDKTKLFGLLLIVTVFIASCTKDPDIVNFRSENYSIKSITTKGKTSAKFTYNDYGKLIEFQSIYSCDKYFYDDNDRLIKLEVAVDPEIFSSSMPTKTTLMTSQNSTFTGRYTFEYNSAGQLVAKKSYFKRNGQFEYTSMTSLEYEGDKIVKSNLHNAQNTITQYYTYEYDSKGNVSNEKYYSFLLTPGTEPELISEASFKYDDKNNPFRIHRALGQPGIYTNTNNPIETNTVLYEDVPGIDKFSTSKTTYEYNDKGFPIRVNGTDEYKYE